MTESKLDDLELRIAQVGALELRIAELEALLAKSPARDTGELEKARRDHAATLRAFATIGESAALLAHEIKNPITAVNLALRAVATELGEDHRVVLEDLVVRMQRIEQMMLSTLSFARPIELGETACDAEVLFDAAVAGLGAIVPSTSIEKRIHAGGVRFVGDPALLRDVLSRLLTNAIEAGPEGSRITLVAERERDGAILLAVEDEGPGVPESLQGSLFEPFVTTKRKGNGMGLAICRKIVEVHGGTLDLAAAKSKPAPTKGARFELRLPASKRIP